MNIRDFSLNDILNSTNSNKISNSNQNILKTSKKTTNSLVSSDSSSSRRGSVSRERVNINSENIIKAEDGSMFDKTAPKGTYVNLVI